MPINRETTASGSEIGLLIGLTRRRIVQLADEGGLPRPDGSFDQNVCRVAYVHWMRGEDRRAVKSEGADRMRDARAAEIEQRMAERARRHIDEANEQAVAVVDAVLGPLRADIYAIPPRVTADLGLRRKMESELDVAFNNAADRAEAYRPETDGQSSQGLLKT